MTVTALSGTKWAPGKVKREGVSVGTHQMAKWLSMSEIQLLGIFYGGCSEASVRCFQWKWDSGFAPHFLAF